LPALAALIERVRAAEDAPVLDGVVIGGMFNASVSQVGWRRRRYITVGLPLMTVLDPQERVALLAHEIGHLVNGDPARGGVTGSALATLREWYILIRPSWYRARGETAIPEAIAASAL